MTHEHNPESAEFRTREAQKATLAEMLEDGMPAYASQRAADREVTEAEARGAAEQRKKDEEKRGLISANLDKPGLIEWSVHILGPDDVHPCGSRAEAEALAEETNILAGSTNRGRSDDEFVTYAAYVVPRFKADREAEQSRKDAEGQEPVGYRWAYDVRKGRDSLWLFGGDLPEPTPYRPEPKHVTPLYTRPANVAALIAEAVAAERERCAKVLDASALRAHEYGADWGERYAKCWAAAIREGGEHV